jgi:hypothetical protein
MGESLWKREIRKKELNQDREREREREVGEDSSVFS